MMTKPRHLADGSTIAICGRVGVYVVATYQPRFVSCKECIALMKSEEEVAS